MRKSKEQKQQEALARKRELFDEKSIYYRRFQVGGDFYQDHVARFGKEYAERRKNEVSISFAKYLIEAQLDFHGNPLAPEAKKPDWESIPKRSDAGAIHAYLRDYSYQ